MPKVDREFLEKSENEKGRREKLAVNLADLGALPTTLRVRLFKGRINLQDVVEIDKNRDDGVAVGFACSLDMAAKLVDIARSEARRDNEPPLRVYLKRDRVWSAVPKMALLTVIEEGQVILNPELFPPLLDLAPLEPPKIKNLLRRG